MEESFFYADENKELKKQVREDIVNCLEEERKKNTELNKRLYELELDMFIVLKKHMDSYFERHSEMASKLHDEIWLYSYLMDIDEKMEFVKIGYKKYIEYKSK